MVKTYALRIGESYEEVVPHADYKALEEKYLSLEKTSNAANYLINRMTAEINEVSVAIGTTRYLDPPDGGSVSLGEQVRRMKAELFQTQAEFAEGQGEYEQLDRLMQANERNMHERIQQLTAELAECRKDAERYQWMRERFRTMSLDMGGKHSYAPMGDIGRLRGPSLDEAIDNAIARSKPE